MSKLHVHCMSIGLHVHRMSVACLLHVYCSMGCMSIACLLHVYGAGVEDMLHAGLEVNGHELV